MPRRSGPVAVESSRRASLRVISTSTGGSCEGLLSILDRLPRPGPSSSAPIKDPDSFPACSAPDVRTPPSFEIALRQPLSLCQLPIFAGDGIDIDFLRIGCVKVTDLTLEIALDLRYAQTWNLLKVGIGDLSSTMGLAPGERLTLEFQSTQRRVLEQSTLDSSEEMTSEESTHMDKEALNVTRASSRTQNWHVDGGGSFSIGKLGINASAGVSTSTSQSAQTTLDHVTESTKKSAHSLKTMHKIEVRGVAETILTNRMTRLLVNPYRDRTMAVNVFQLVKHFDVEAELTEIRPVLLLTIRDLAFDDDFVIANSDFLRDELTDPSLVSELPQSLHGALPVPTDAIQDATNIAKFALSVLYVEPNIFNMPHIHSGMLNQDLGDPNPPATSFDASHPQSAFADANGDSDNPQGATGIILTTLNMYYKSYLARLNNDPLAPDEIALAATLAADVGPKWTTVQADEKRVTWLLDNGSFTETFRRLSGFLAIVGGMLNPLLDRASQQRQAVTDRENDRFALDRLKRHLECNRHYYIQRFLGYLSRKTLGLAITDFVDLALARANVNTVGVGRFEIERSFIDRDAILVPWYRALTDRDMKEIAQALGDEGGFDFSEIIPAAAEVQVPTDGIHLEVAAGACILASLPDPPAESVELSVKDASVKIGA